MYLTNKDSENVYNSTPVSVRSGSLRIRAMLLVFSFQVVLLIFASYGKLPLLGASLFSPAVFLEWGTDFESMASGLSKKGMAAKAPAVIVGKSGVKHEFAFALVPDSGNPKVVVDTELSVKEVDEMKVLKFYVKVYDVSPEKAVLCVSPKLTVRAAELAHEYGIEVLENDTPKKLIPMAARVVDGVLSSK